jgi:hypothetical protein
LDQLDEGIKISLRRRDSPIPLGIAIGRGHVKYAQRPLTQEGNGRQESYSQLHTLSLSTASSALVSIRVATVGSVDRGVVGRGRTGSLLGEASPKIYRMRFG